MGDWGAASRHLLVLQQRIDAGDGDLQAALALIVRSALKIIPPAQRAIVALDQGDRHHCAIAGSPVLDGAARPDRSGLAIEPRPAAAPGPCACARPAGCAAVSGGAAPAAATILVPLRFAGAPAGLLTLHAEPAAPFAGPDRLIAALLAGPVALALAKAERRRLARAHDLLARRFAATFDQAAVGIAHVSPAGQFLCVNDRFCEIAGHPRAALIAGGFQQITHPEDLAADLENVAALLAGRIAGFSMEKRYVTAGGALIWVNLTVSLSRDAAGSPDFLVAVIEDIDARKQAERLASFDPLTGLPNRRMLFERLEAQLAGPGPNTGKGAGPGNGTGNETGTGGLPHALAYIDLDDFKSVNDRFGHGEGDRCLVAVAEALKQAVRSGDLLGRIAGDEFVLLMPDVTEAALPGLLARLEAAIRAMPCQARWGVAASVGAILSHPASRPTPALVLHAADQLMYRVKRRRAGRIAIRWFGDDQAGEGAERS